MIIECPKCEDVDTTIRADTDSPKAAKVVIICPACDDGDFHSPEFYDAEGRHLDEETGEPFV